MTYVKLRPEDYMEPECPLCDKPVGYRQKKDMIPQQRISQKLDEMMGAKDHAGAERMLKYWLNEATANGDDQGKFMIYNEMMGFYRKVSDKNNAYESICKACSMIPMLGYSASVSGATCYINAATVYTSFGEPELAIEYFRRAEKIYSGIENLDPIKLAGLYNNMATAYCSMNESSRAWELFSKALDTLRDCTGSEPEQAITYLNMIDIIVDGDDEEKELKIAEHLGRAQELLDSESVPHDGYYAFVCDKCISIYEYFGWFRYVKQLKERIASINERT